MSTTKERQNRQVKEKRRQTPHHNTDENPLPVEANNRNDQTPPNPPVDFPKPSVLSGKSPLLWDEDRSAVENYVRLGQELAAAGDVFRNPQYGAGLLLGSPCGEIPPIPITQAKQLASVLADRLKIIVFKNGKEAGGMPSSSHLTTMLGAEVFLQQFLPLDRSVAVPMYLGFNLTKPGYNDGGRGQRIYYTGSPPPIAKGLDAVSRFLDVMQFASNADRTNTVAAALTVMLRNHWLGAKPLIAVTSTKSHGGKDTVITFAAGCTPQVSLSYERQDWALQKNFSAVVQQHPNLGLLNIENVRLDGKNGIMASSFLERYLTDPEPVLFSTGTGNLARRTNDLVLACSTNFGRLSEDLHNRSLPIHLEPVGDVASRTTPIGNPKLEYLPKHKEAIAAEFRGMIERWKTAGQPRMTSVKHPFTDWGQTLGGILEVAGFTDFLENYGVRKTADDPLRNALGILGAARRDEWLRPADWVLVTQQLGLTKRLIPEADRDSSEGRTRGLGSVLSAHREETFHVETDDELVMLQLQKCRRRFDGREPQTRYKFRVVESQTLPENDE